MREFLKGKKTYIVAALLFGVALIDYMTGDISLQELLRSSELLRMLEAVGLASIRAGIAKK